MDTKIALLSAEEIANWRLQGPEVRSGTACKCGAHNSASWLEGGEEWFEGHVLENHVDEKRKLAKLFLEFAFNTKIEVPTQTAFTPGEVDSLLAVQRREIARKISNLLEPEEAEAKADA